MQGLPGVQQEDKIIIVFQMLLFVAVASGIHHINVVEEKNISLLELHTVLQ